MQPKQSRVSCRDWGGFIRLAQDQSVTAPGAVTSRPFTRQTARVSLTPLMNTRISLRLFLTALAVASTGPVARAQAPASPPPATDAAPKVEPAAKPVKPLPADPEERFKFLFTNATLSGRWAPLKDGVLGEQRDGDRYQIVGVVKGDGDKWTVQAKMKYRGQEMVMPIPVRMQFSGDTAILLVDNLSIPGGGTYTARLLIYERTYSGTWTSPRGGGMLYGTITGEGN